MYQQISGCAYSKSLSCRCVHVRCEAQLKVAERNHLHCNSYNGNVKVLIGPESTMGSPIETLPTELHLLIINHLPRNHRELLPLALTCKTLYRVTSSILLPARESAQNINFTETPTWQEHDPHAGPSVVSINGLNQSLHTAGDPCTVQLLAWILRNRIAASYFHTLHIGVGLRRASNDRHTWSVGRGELERWFGNSELPETAEATYVGATIEVDRMLQDLIGIEGLVDRDSWMEYNLLCGGLKNDLDESVNWPVIVEHKSRGGSHGDRAVLRQSILRGLQYFTVHSLSTLHPTLLPNISSLYVQVLGTRHLELPALFAILSSPTHLPNMRRFGLDAASGINVESGLPLPSGELEDLAVTDMVMLLPLFQRPALREIHLINVMLKGRSSLFHTKFQLLSPGSSGVRKIVIRRSLVLNGARLVRLLTLPSALTDLTLDVHTEGPGNDFLERLGTLLKTRFGDSMQTLEVRGCIDSFPYQCKNIEHPANSTTNPYSPLQLVSNTDGVPVYQLGPRITNLKLLASLNSLTISFTHLFGAGFEALKELLPVEDCFPPAPTLSDLPQQIHLSNCLPPSLKILCLASPHHHINHFGHPVPHAALWRLVILSALDPSVCLNLPKLKIVSLEDKLIEMMNDDLATHNVSGYKSLSRFSVSQQMSGSRQRSEQDTPHQQPKQGIRWDPIWEHEGHGLAIDWEALRAKLGTEVGPELNVWRVPTEHRPRQGPGRLGLFEWPEGRQGLEDDSFEGKDIQAVGQGDGSANNLYEGDDDS